MGKTKRGICCICGEEKELTYEHIPPKAAFNHFNLKLYDFYSYVTQNNKNTKICSKERDCIHYARNAIMTRVHGMVLHMPSLQIKVCVTTTRNRQGL